MKPQRNDNAASSAPTPLKTLGHSTTRIDAVERVTGRAKYTGDVQLPGMLFARVLRSPHPHARIKSIDVSRARALPGVKAVITHENGQVVWGAGSFVPEQCVELHRLLIDDIDLPAARDLWTRLWPLCRFLESQSYPAAVKTACGLVGDTTGPVRAPVLPLDRAATAELAALLDHATLPSAHASESVVTS